MIYREFWAYFAGVIFVLLNVFHFYWFIYELKQNYERKGVFTPSGIQFIFIVPTLPYFSGIYQSVEQLLVPFLISVFISGAFTSGCIVEIDAVSNHDLGLTEWEKNNLFTFLGISTVLHFPIFVYAFLYWWRLREFTKNEPPSYSGQYPYRRYDTLKLDK